ncbi:MAG: YdcF family protein [Fimbriimonadaceae bacterium]
MAIGVLKGERRRVRTWKRALVWSFWFLVVFGVGFGWICFDIWKFSGESAVGNADAAVVLGAAAWGPKPSPVFAARLDHAADLYLDGRVKKVIVTGGVGRLGGPSEAEVGRNYLVKKGVKRGDVIEENQSRRTFDNLRNAMGLMTKAGLGDCFVVSDPLHMRRSIAIADGLGMRAKASPTEHSAYRGSESRGKFLVREAWFMLGYRLGLVR